MAAERNNQPYRKRQVQGTAVYGADGEKIGSIERVMIEKSAGRYPMPC